MGCPREARLSTALASPRPGCQRALRLRRSPHRIKANAQRGRSYQANQVLQLLRLGNVVRKLNIIARSVAKPAACKPNGGKLVRVSDLEDLGSFINAGYSPTETQHSPA